MSEGRKEENPSKIQFQGFGTARALEGITSSSLTAKAGSTFPTIHFVCVHSPGKGIKSGSESTQPQGLNPPQREGGTWKILGDFCSLPFHGGGFCKASGPHQKLFFLILFYSCYKEWGSDSAHVFPITTKSPGTNPKRSALPGKRERNPTRNNPQAAGAGKGLRSHPSSADPLRIFLSCSTSSSLGCSALCSSSTPAPALPFPLPSHAGHCCLYFFINQKIPFSAGCREKVWWDEREGDEGREALGEIAAPSPKHHRDTEGCCGTAAS